MTVMIQNNSSYKQIMIYDHSTLDTEHQNTRECSCQGGLIFLHFIIYIIGIFLYKYYINKSDYSGLICVIGIHTN